MCQNCSFVHLSESLSGCLCEQVEMKSMQERLEVEKQTWEENYRKKEVCWPLLFCRTVKASRTLEPFSSRILN